MGIVYLSRRPTIRTINIPPPSAWAEAIGCFSCRLNGFLKLEVLSFLFQLLDSLIDPGPFLPLQNVCLIWPPTRHGDEFGAEHISRFAVLRKLLTSDSSRGTVGIDLLLEREGLRMCRFLPGKPSISDPPEVLYLLISTCSSVIVGPPKNPLHL